MEPFHGSVCLANIRGEGRLNACKKLSVVAFILQHLFIKKKKKKESSNIYKSSVAQNNNSNKNLKSWI